MTQIERANKLLAQELGLNPYGEPLYKWVQAHRLRLRRYRQGKDDWKQGPSGVWYPTPEFEDVPAFPRLEQRWVLAIWQYEPKESFQRRYGNRVWWEEKGYYFPTDKVLKKGMVPDVDVTRYFAECIKYSREKTFAEIEQELENEMAREDAAQFHRIHDAVLEACTAFGKEPGKRNGGVSVFSGRPEDPVELKQAA